MKIPTPLRLRSLGSIRVASLSLVAAGFACAASHSDAPLIKQDPQANLTDVYAFVGKCYSNPALDVLNVIVSVRPFSEPGDGVIYDRFADDALYSIHITDPATGREKTRYDFLFSDVNPLHGAGLKNPDTILSYGLGTEVGPIEEAGDARQNYTQYYWVFKNNRYKGWGTAAPPNVGGRTTPHYNDANGDAVSGAVDLAGLDSYTREAIQDLHSGESVFAGPRDDGFYADTPGVFDLLDARILDNNGDLSDGLGQDGGGVDGFKGFNVLTFGIQIPLPNLHPSKYNAAFADLGAQDLPAVAESTGVGVYASVSRRRITLRSNHRENRHAGGWVQVNRMGNPLFNEVLVALAGKDRYNRSSPVHDAARFGTYAENPEVAGLINTVFGTNFATSGRGDLQLVFLPDVLRVDTTTGAVPLPGQTGFSRFGFAGGDTVTNVDGHVVSSGWPNGRRPGDDVVDLALTAVASGPSYNPVTVVGDNVPANDQLFNQVFPYLATPHAGSRVNMRQAP